MDSTVAAVVARPNGSRSVGLYGDDVTGTSPTADVTFRIGSITKSFTAATVMMLVEDGLLDLDDEVAEHLDSQLVPMGATVRSRQPHRCQLDGPAMLTPQGSAVVFEPELQHRRHPSSVPDHERRLTYRLAVRGVSLCSHVPHRFDGGVLSLSCHQSPARCVKSPLGLLTQCAM